jgi:hypothetical protein
MLLAFAESQQLKGRGKARAFVVCEVLQFFSFVFRHLPNSITVKSSLPSLGSAGGSRWKAKEPSVFVLGRQCEILQGSSAQRLL